MRKAVLSRKTKETCVTVTLSLDEKDTTLPINTGIGFFDHMLDLLRHHSGFLLSIEATGDLQTGCHHTVEDVGIVLGQAFKEALGDKIGIERYSTKIIPMDECLALVSVDLANRAAFVYDVPFSVSMIGGFETEMMKEFFIAFAQNAGLALHIKMLTAGNNHHMAEAVFKAFARALKEAVQITSDDVVSSKGVL